MNNGEIIRQLFIPDNRSVLELLRKWRWSSGVRCPYCDTERVIKSGITHHASKVQQYRCYGCAHYFNDLTGTIFSHQKMSIGELFYIMVNIEVKSINKIAQELGRCWESVNNFASKVRQASGVYKDILKPSGFVESDEVYVNAGNKGNHKNPDKPGRKRGRKGRGRGTFDNDRPPVLTLYDRSKKL